MVNRSLMHHKILIKSDIYNDISSSIQIKVSVLQRSNTTLSLLNNLFLSTKYKFK